MRVQVKLTSVLMLMGILSCIAVGIIANVLVQYDFRESIRQKAFRDFSSDFIEYTQEYGGLDNALAAESFHQFILRRHPKPSAGGAGSDPELLVERGVPQFKFVAFDKDGRVIEAGGAFPIGSKVPEEYFDGAVPIQHEGEFIAWLASRGRVALTETDRVYLDSVRRSILIGTGVAIAGSILLGLVFGGGLSRRFNRLTRAIRTMQTDHGIECEMPVMSDDELGELAEAFNCMNRDLVKAQRELKELSVRDPLTNLYNRRHFDEQARQHFEQAKRYKQPLAIMIGDLDRFKDVNDRFSHGVGDQVLQRVASILKESTRKSDVIARYGGEEFVVMFPNTGEEQAVVSCENIRRRVQEYAWKEIHPELGVTISIGLTGDEDADSVGRMLSRADRCLYGAKSRGRNKVSRSPDIE